MKSLVTNVLRFKTPLERFNSLPDVRPMDSAIDVLALELLHAEDLQQRWQSDHAVLPAPEEKPCCTEPGRLRRNE